MTVKEYKQLKQSRLEAQDALECAERKLSYISNYLKHNEMSMLREHSLWMDHNDLVALIAKLDNQIYALGIRIQTAVHH